MARPNATRLAPRNTQPDRTPCTSSTAPITTAYNVTVADDNTNPPTLNVANPTRPILRPDSTGAPVIASHHPERMYVPAHGRLRTTPDTMTAAVTTTQRAAHLTFVPCTTLTTVKIIVTSGTIRTTDGSKAITVPTNSTRHANHLRHSAVGATAINSSDNSSSRSAWPTNMRNKCTIHGNVAYINNAPHRPDDIAAYGKGTAA